MGKRSIKFCNDEPFIYRHGSKDGHPHQIRVIDLSDCKYITLLDDSLSIYENVEVIALRNCNLTQIPEGIFKLKKIKKIFLGGNKIEKIPDELFGISGLEELQLSNNSLEIIPSNFTSLRKLKRLWLNGNNIKEIPPSFGEFKSLQKLYLSQNIIERIPIEIFTISTLKGIYLDGNPLSTIPIYNFIGNSLEKLRIYYKSIANGVDRSYEAKVILLGDGAVGKTTLIHSLTDKKDNYYKVNTYVKETKGVEVKDWVASKIEEDGREYDVTIKIWDFGGQEIQSEVHHLFLSNETLYMLLWANRVVNDKNRYLKTWLNKIESYGGNDSKVIVIQTMFGEKETSYSNIDRDKFSKIYNPLIVDFLNISAHYNIGIHNRGGLKDMLIKHVLDLPHVGKEISVKWNEIKSEIRILRYSQNIIPVVDFLKICESQDINKSESKLILSWLHNIGEILYYEKPRQVSKYIFLDPNWVTNVFYRIIIDDDKIIFNNNGIFSLDDINDYISEEEEVVVDLMEKFDICFKIDDMESIYIFPALLPLNEIDKDFSFLAKLSKVIQYEIRFQMLSNSFLSRFISKCYKDGLVYFDFYWKDGVVLKIDKSFLKVYRNNDTKEINASITVDIYGESSWYSLIRIREIFKSLLTNVVVFDEVICCTSGINCKEKLSYFFDIALIEKATSMKVDTLQCGQCFRNIPVGHLVPKISRNPSTASSEIKHELSRGNILKAINSMLELADSLDGRVEKKLILYKSQYNIAKKKKLEGIISDESFDVKISGIVKSLLLILSDDLDYY